MKTVLQPRYPVLVPDSALVLATIVRFYHSLPRVIDIELILDGIEGTISIDERFWKHPMLFGYIRSMPLPVSLLLKGDIKANIDELPV